MKRTVLLAAVLLFAPSLFAQEIPPYPVFGPVITPEVQLGSKTTPSVVTDSPIIFQGPSGLYDFQEPLGPYGSHASNVPPASTALLATRHFDYIVSPVDEFVPGSLADTTISLGEYARQLRAKKHSAASWGAPLVSPTPTPNTMANPTENK